VPSLQVRTCSQKNDSPFLTIPFGVISYAALVMPIGGFVGFGYPSLNR